MPVFTIFTPTYNRCDLLPRLYESIKKQTFKDFVWLVVNEKSVDCTLEVLKSFQKEGIVDIHIVDNPYIPTVKYTALRYAFERCETPYLIDLDDDDELLPCALQTFYNEILSIKKGDNPNIASIRALTVDDTGHIMVKGIDQKKLFPPFTMSYLDTSFNFSQMENITCFFVEKVREAHIFDNQNFYMGKQASYFIESIFWGRLSRVYTTRYIPVVLRLYHITELSALRHPKTRQSYFTALINLKILFEEQNDYFKRSWKEYFKMIGMMSTLTCALGNINYFDFLSNLKCGKFWFMLFCPIGFVISAIKFKGQYKK